MSDQFLKTREETQTWLAEMGIIDYTVGDDLVVNVAGDVNISNKNLTMIPVQFGVLDGDFNCSFNRLTTLIGAPESCRIFDCYNNRLTSLIGGPVSCLTIDCSDNEITGLTGAPKTCDFFYCSHNQIISLNGAPDCCQEMDCSDNHLSSLAGMPMICFYFECHRNPALFDISSIPDGCNAIYDRDVVAKNQSAQQLKNLHNGGGGYSTPAGTGRTL